MWALNIEVAGGHKAEQADRHMKDRILQHQMMHITHVRMRLYHS